MPAIDWKQVGQSGAPAKAGAIDWVAVNAPAEPGSTPSARVVAAAANPPAQTGGAWDAFKHHLGNLPYGAGQLLANGAATLAHKVQPGSDLDRDTAAMAARANADMAKREQQYQATVPDGVGVYAGAAAGEVLPWLAEAPAKAVGAVGDAAAAATRRAMLAKTLQNTAAGKIVQGGASAAAQGATVAALSPVTQGGSYWDEKAGQMEGGALAGTAFKGLVNGGMGLAGQVKGALAPWLNPNAAVAPVLASMTPNDAAAAAQLLRSAPELVPGSKPTTAQVLQSPQAVMVEKAVGNTPAGKVAMTERQNANNAARLAHMDKFAGDDSALAAALAARRANASPMTQSLPSAPPVDATPILQHLDKIGNSGLGTNPVIRGAAGDVRRLLAEKGAPGDDGSLFVKPDILDGIRQNLGGVLRQHASNGAVSSREEAALEPLKNTIVDTIDSGVPGYRDYLAAYRADSVPVNTMEQMQKLRAAADTRALNSSGDPSLTLNNARQAVAQLDRGKYPVSPEAAKATDDILADMQRESVSSSVRSPGSDTALNLQAPNWLASQLYGDGFSGKTGWMPKGVGAGLGAGAGYLGGSAFGPTAAGWAAGTGASVGAGLMSKLASTGSSKVNQALVDALMNPDIAAAVLERHSAHQPANPALARLLRQRAAMIGTSATEQQ